MVQSATVDALVSHSATTHALVSVTPEHVSLQSGHTMPWLQCSMYEGVYGSSLLSTLRSANTRPPTSHNELWLSTMPHNVMWHCCPPMLVKPSVHGIMPDHVTAITAIILREQSVIYWELNKMADNLQTFSNVISYKKILNCWFKFHWHLVLSVSMTICHRLGYLMAWHHTSTMPLVEPMVTQSTNTYASLSINVLVVIKVWT